MDKEPENNKPDKFPRGSPPQWDLRDIFPSPESAAFQAAREEVAQAAQEFSNAFHGRVRHLTADHFGAAIARYEEIVEHVARISSYALLTAAADDGSARWAQGVAEDMIAVQGDLLFFTLEINEMKEADILRRLKSLRAAGYADWIAAVRGLQGHQLAEDAEKYMAEKSTVADQAWKRLYAQTADSLRFSFKGRVLTQSEILKVINSAKEPDDRRAAFESFAHGLQENKAVFTLVTNTLADLKASEDARRAFTQVQDSRHLADQTDPDIAAVMTQEVRSAYARTAHRYYTWKARKLGVKRLHPADRAAPPSAMEKTAVSWAQARESVLRGYDAFSAEMGSIARKFFDDGWIDAAPRAGKIGGAFSNAVTPKVHPYLMINFSGTPLDVKTLAHELGRGVQQYLSASQGYLQARAPLTLAETAAAFGEVLVFRDMLSQEQDLYAKRDMLAGRVENLLDTVVRQTAFLTFEQRVYDAHRVKGELSAAQIAALWRETQKESLGPGVDVATVGADALWMAAPHFTGGAFHGYAAGFGACLSAILEDAYVHAADKGVFAEKYLGMLKAGGTQTTDAALAAFDFDAADPAFWRRGMDVIEHYISDLEVLDQKIATLEKAKADFRATGKGMTDIDAQPLHPKMPPPKPPQSSSKTDLRGPA